jgi:hypothetical protein
MNISLFNRPYRVRRFTGQNEVKGYVTYTYTDLTISMHVHPSGNDSVQSLPEGERVIRRLEAHCPDELVTTDQDSGTKGDLLYYNGRWYECTSSSNWDHTLLSHNNYQFVVVPKDSAGTTDISEPDLNGL